VDGGNHANQPQIRHSAFGSSRQGKSQHSADGSNGGGGTYEGGVGRKESQAETQSNYYPKGLDWHTGSSIFTSPPANL